MKKVFFLAATAALALSSCSENEITSNVENSRRTPISVSVYSKGQTRAVTDIDVLKSEGFDLIIKAASVDQPLFNDICTFDNTGVWNLGTDPIYWPLNEEEVVSFYALYSSTAESTGIEPAQNSYTSEVYLSTDADADVVAAYASSSLKGNGANGGEMALTFSHLLSEIHFGIKGAEAGMVYTLKKVTLVGASSGTVTFGTTCSITANPQSEETYTVFDSEVAGTAPVVNDATNGLTTDPTAVGTVSLMLVPDTYAVSVTYQVANGTDTQDFTKGGTIDLSANAGKKTAATLSLPASRTPLTIDTSVAEWATGTGVTPNLQ